jgi:succinate dehydrogenase / fumarate reductase cytochrome b subunit
MAATGAGMFLFVIGHMVGNLQFFLGADAINRYGHFLQSNLEIIWPARIGLLVMVALHVWSAISLSRENKAARPVPYADWQPNTASYASRTMLMSGLIIAAFIVYHLLHYTVMVKEINMSGLDFHSLVDSEGRHDIYTMMKIGFSKPLVSLFYVIAVGLLCLHLSHGLSAMFQSLGLKNHVYAPLIDKGSKVIALALFLGYAAIPISVLLTSNCGACCK